MADQEVSRSVNTVNEWPSQSPVKPVDVGQASTKPSALRPAGERPPLAASGLHKAKSLRSAKERAPMRAHLPDPHPVQVQEQLFEYQGETRVVVSTGRGPLKSPDKPQSPEREPDRDPDRVNPGLAGDAHLMKALARGDWLKERPTMAALFGRVADAMAQMHRYETAAEEVHRRSEHTVPDNEHDVAKTRDLTGYIRQPLVEEFWRVSRQMHELETRCRQLESRNSRQQALITNLPKGRTEQDLANDWNAYVASKAADSARPDSMPASKGVEVKDDTTNIETPEVSLGNEELEL
jgi:hypothetical protein